MGALHINRRKLQSVERLRYLVLVARYRQLHLYVDCAGFVARSNNPRDFVQVFNLLRANTQTIFGSHVQSNGFKSFDYVGEAQVHYHSRFLVAWRAGLDTGCCCFFIL